LRRGCTGEQKNRGDYHNQGWNVASFYHFPHPLSDVSHGAAHARGPLTRGWKGQEICLWETPDGDEFSKPAATLSSQIAGLSEEKNGQSRLPSGFYASMRLDVPPI
jgi:hypothetical protein